MELVSINQVRHRFAGSEDIEFEVACERMWGDIPVTLSIYRATESDGQEAITPQGEIQWADGDYHAFMIGPDDKPENDNDLICSIWHVSPDEEVWEITMEGS
jgi:hypothetical protein